MGLSLQERDQGSPFGTAAKTQDSTPGTAPALSAGTAPATAAGQTGGAQNADAAWRLFGNFADGERKPGAATTPGEATRPKTVSDYSGGLDKNLDALINSNRTDRTALDALKRKGDPGAGKSEGDLDAHRTELLKELKERSGVYNTDIKTITDQLGDKPIKDPTAEQKKLMADRDALIKGRDQYKDQQTSLQRWDDRNHINDINSKLGDPNLSAKEKQDLLAQKRTLATGLLSTTKHWEQFDPQWGETSYGKGKGFSNMREAGCGPTALADLLDFADQEDPEGKHSRGDKNYYNPRRAADYAEGHGRVRDQGTDGAKMFHDLPLGFEGMHGQGLGGMAGARQSLENGIPVAVQAHNLRGQNADGNTVKKYKGHFITLDGVSQDGSTYNVQDGGRHEGNNIHTMTSKQLNSAGVGYYNMGR